MNAPGAAPAPLDLPAPAPPLHVLGFVLAGEVYAIGMDWVKEVLLYAHPTPLSNLPNFVKGLLSVRGRMVPIFDLAELMNLPPLQPRLDSAILVVEVSGRRIGLGVERIYNLLKIEPSAMVDVPRVLAEPRLDFLIGATSLGEHLMFVVDVPRILTSWHLAVAKEASARAAE